MATLSAVGYGAPVLSLREFAFQVAAVSFYMLPISYAGLLILGLPSLVFLDMLGRLNLCWLIVVAAVEGIIVVFLLLSVLGFSWTAAFQNGNAISVLGSGAAVAAGVAIAFWFISGHHTGVRRGPASSDADGAVSDVL